MAKPDDEGPLLVWSFPLIRTLQDRDGILSLGVGDILDDGISDTDNDSSNNTSPNPSSNKVQDQDDVLDDIEDSIDELDSNGEMLYEASDDLTIQVGEEGFDPSESDIGIGDTVTWVNQGDTTARISSTEDDFTSPILDPGDTYEQTFYAPQEIEYKDPTSGSSERGVVNVGLDAEPSDVDPVPFDDEESDSTRSMDEAVSDKENDGRGFD
jgi:plastocyanin